MPDAPPVEMRPDQWDIVRAILRKNVPDREVWAFGSRAGRTAKRYSDLDLAVIGDTPLPWRTAANLANDFSDSDLPWRVDIIDWATTSPTFREIIRANYVVVHPRPVPASATPTE
jgi:type I restriction enzyme S subunit